MTLTGKHQTDFDLPGDLFLNLIQNLQRSIINIIDQVDLIKISEDSQGLENIKNLAINSNHLIESYNLVIRLLQDQASLSLEAVSLSSVLFNVVENLKLVAKNYEVNLVFNNEGKFYPVLADRVVLESSLTSLGISLIEALPAFINKQPRQIDLFAAIHRSKYGLVIGLYFDDQPTFSRQLITKNQTILRRANQPLPLFSYNAASGIFLAKSMLSLMNLDLVASKHHGLHGLGLVMSPIRQLSLMQ